MEKAWQNNKIESLLHSISLFCRFKGGPPGLHACTNRMRLSSSLKMGTTATLDVLMATQGLFVFLPSVLELGH